MSKLEACVCVCVCVCACVCARAYEEAVVTYVGSTNSACGLCVTACVGLARIMYLYTYGVYIRLYRQKSSNTRSYTVYVYGADQPHTCVLYSSSELLRWLVDPRCYCTGLENPELCDGHYCECLDTTICNGHYDMQWTLRLCRVGQNHMYVEKENYAGYENHSPH
jgi:hypothetical protein